MPPGWATIYLVLKEDYVLFLLLASLNETLGQGPFFKMVAPCSQPVLRATEPLREVPSHFGRDFVTPNAKVRLQTVEIFFRNECPSPVTCLMEATSAARMLRSYPPTLSVLLGGWPRGRLPKSGLPPPGTFSEEKASLHV